MFGGDSNWIMKEMSWVRALGAGWSLRMLVLAAERERERESFQRPNQVLMWLRTTWVVLNLALRLEKERLVIEVWIAESSANWGSRRVLR